MMTLLSSEGGLQSAVAGLQSGNHSRSQTAIGLKSDRGGLKSALHEGDILIRQRGLTSALHTNTPQNGAVSHV